MDEYRVYSVDWAETADDAISFDVDDDEDACQAWCERADGNGNFVDGYPDNHLLCVIRPDGSEARMIVSTDWEPSFFIRAALEAEGGRDG